MNRQLLYNKTAGRNYNILNGEDSLDYKNYSQTNQGQSMNKFPKLQNTQSENILAKNEPILQQQLQSPQQQQQLQSPQQQQPLQSNRGGFQNNQESLQDLNQRENSLPQQQNIIPNGHQSMQSLEEIHKKPSQRYIVNRPDNYHTQNLHYGKKYRLPPKQYIIDYQLGKPQDYNNHFSVGQNFKSDFIRKQAFIRENDAQNGTYYGNRIKNSISYAQDQRNQSVDNNKDIQKYREQVLGHTLRPVNNDQSTGNQTQNQQKVQDQLYHNYKKNAIIEKNRRKLIRKSVEVSGGDNGYMSSLQNNIYGKEYDISSDDKVFPVSTKNFQSMDYNPINFSSKNQEEKQRTHNSIYNEKNYNFANIPKNGQFRKGGVFTRYLDELKISATTANPIYNEKYQMGNLDFKLQNGMFTDVYDNPNFFNKKPFRKYK